MAIIGVDVDQTIVRSDLGLIDWLNSRSSVKHTFDSLLARRGKIPYDISESYPDLSRQDTLDYWHRSDVYDNLKPIRAAHEELQKLSRYHDIVFVSKVVGDHYASKRRFLENHFDFMSGFIATCDKQFANIDLLIDDRLDVLQSVKHAGIIPVQFHTKYTQSVDFKPDFIMYDWYECIELIEEIGV